MDITIEDIRSDLEILNNQKEEINKQLIFMNSNINHKQQELINMLKKKLVGKFVKQNFNGHVYYGIIHDIVDINTVKVMNVGFTVNNKIDRSCKHIDIDDLIFVSEDEVANYIFDFINDQYKKWRIPDN